MKPKWEWILVKPGVIALSGTPFQIREDTIWHKNGPTTGKSFFCVFDGSKLAGFGSHSQIARMIAESLAEEMMGRSLVVLG